MIKKIEIFKATLVLKQLFKEFELLATLLNFCFINKKDLSWPVIVLVFFKFALIKVFVFQIERDRQIAVKNTNTVRYLFLTVY